MTTSPPQTEALGRSLPAPYGFINHVDFNSDNPVFNSDRSNFKSRPIEFSVLRETSSQSYPEGPPLPGELTSPTSKSSRKARHGSDAVAGPAPQPRLPSLRAVYKPCVLVCPPWTEPPRWVAPRFPCDGFRPPRAHPSESAPPARTSITRPILEGDLPDWVGPDTSLYQVYCILRGSDRFRFVQICVGDRVKLL